MRAYNILTSLGRAYPTRVKNARARQGICTYRGRAQPCTPRHALHFIRRALNFYRRA